MLVKHGRFFKYYLENEEVTLEIENWEAPFGLENFGRKSIVNLKVPNNNSGLNLENMLNQIQNEILKEMGEYARLPLKNGTLKLLRCEVKSSILIEKNEKISGKLSFNIYNFKGNWGVSVIL